MSTSNLRKDTIEEHKTLILKEYRRQKWKISLVGGSIAHFNRRRHFIAFLERYVINPKNEELREKVKRLMSIVIVQTRIASYM
jgi:desulfoferrodoxin (superoxide reductase-like protein)